MKLYFYRAAVFTVALLFLLITGGFAENGSFSGDENKKKTVKSEKSGKKSSAEEMLKALGIDASDVDNTTVLEKMDVLDKSLKETTEGKTVLDNNFITNVPKGDGNISEMLKIMPSVQFDEGYKTSDSAGEIKPPKLSISGGKAYDNLFLIDGINNSSILDPEADNPYSINDVPGHPEKFFIDSDLVEKVNVYDSSVPARYGGFLGGVVDVELKEPEPWLSGYISFRHTEDSWTKIHIEENGSSGSLSDKPRFDKNHYFLGLNAPVGKKTALNFSYKKMGSKIPLIYFRGWKNERRESDNFMLNGICRVDNDISISTIATYFPYKGKYFISRAKDSEFEIKGGGYALSTSYKNKKIGNGFDARISYSSSENSKDAPNIYYNWLAMGDKLWGFYLDYDFKPDKETQIISALGGFGSIEKKSTDLTLTVNQSHKSAGKFIRHNLSYGVNASRITGIYDRTETAVIYKKATYNPDVICGASEGINCVGGQQYFKEKQIYEKGKVDTSLNKVSVYFQDLMEKGPVILNIGARYNYDDYMDTHTLSPRSSLTLSVSEKLNLKLYGGLNRYYGSSSLLSNKLREGRKPFIAQYRTTWYNRVKDWQPTSYNGEIKYRFSGLKVPYSNEYSAGASIGLFGGELYGKYIERHNRDEFAKERSKTNKDGYYYYYLNNNGKSEYRSAQLKWSKSWENHSININGMWQEVKANTSNYDFRYDDGDTIGKVYFKGKLVTTDELPKTNYNRPVIANIAYVGRFFEHLTISPFINFRDSYQNLVTDGFISFKTGKIDPVTGKEITDDYLVYMVKDMDSIITVDLSIKWEQKIYKSNKLTFLFDISNLFNVVEYAGGSNTYELGRQFWAGIKYDF